MSHLNFPLCEEETTYRKVQNFYKKHSYINLGLIRLTQVGLRVKFKLCNNKHLDCAKWLVGALVGGL